MCFAKSSSFNPLREFRGLCAGYIRDLRREGAEDSSLAEGLRECLAFTAGFFSGSLLTSTSIYEFVVGETSISELPLEFEKPVFAMRHSVQSWAL